MAETPLPLLIEPDELESLLGRDDLLVVDLGKASTYRQIHIPGALHLEYGDIVREKKPSHGLLPDRVTLEQVFSNAGIGNHVHVIAYDDEGGGNAARLLWTLETMGHTGCTLLNGGLHAWANERFPVENRPVSPEAASFSAAPTASPVADTEYIVSQLGDPETALIDARSAEEYTGARRFSARGGHIPGAVNFEWTTGMDRNRNLRMRPTDELISQLGELGITQEKQIISYCQTHHRSSYSYWMLRVLDFPRVRGYPGSWSVWGNRTDTPIA